MTNTVNCWSNATWWLMVMATSRTLTAPDNWTDHHRWVSDLPSLVELQLSGFPSTASEACPEAKVVDCWLGLKRATLVSVT